MKTSIGQKIKIGVFTMVGILIFIAGIFFIGSQKNMFSNTYMIYGVFSNVGGLNVGNNVRFAGINVGTVEDIRIISDTLIRVEMNMKENVRPFLKVDVVATIGGDGLMGDKLVTITSGSPNETKLLTGGSRIMTVDPIDYDKVIAKFTSVADHADVIMRELAGMAIQIREGNGTISKLLYTDDLSRSLEGTALNAEKITGSFADIAAHIRAGRGSLGSLVYTDSLANGLDRVVASANTTMGTIDKTLGNVDETLGTIDEAAYGFSENMKALHGNYFLRGYFKRKAAEEAELVKAGKDLTAEENSHDSGLTEEDLKEIIAEAQELLEAKKKGKAVK